MGAGPPWWPGSPVNGLLGCGGRGPAHSREQPRGRRWQGLAAESWKSGSEKEMVKIKSWMKQTNSRCVG